jgi:signal transduction histidine kinase
MPDSILKHPQELIADLQQKLAECRAERDQALAERDEALAQQVAIAEVLQVVNSSPGDLGPVFNAMLEKALHLCEAAFGSLLRFDGKFFRRAAIRNFPPPLAERDQPIPPFPGSALERLTRDEPVAMIEDITVDQVTRSGDPGRLAMAAAGARTAIWVALRKDDTLLGAFVAYRQEVRPFSERQVALLENFAAQAVIAMENARLINETREALEQQIATAEVLRIINSSPGDLAPVFETLLEKAHQLCEASFGALMIFDKDRFYPVAVQGVPREFREFIQGGIHPSTGNPFARMVEGEAFSHIPDLSEVAAAVPDDPLPRAAVDLGGIRSFLIVPLRKDGTLLGAITAYRQEVRPFTTKQITLLQNFAAQAVIAMENARLITETRSARDAAETALRNLQAAQTNLVQAQKMAALGQLTAGIAHEIKNPLNFVNNFAGLSIELLDELKVSAAPGIATLDNGTRTEIDETIGMLTSNLDKIAEHGKRADNIVKSMLEHSRGVSGERRAVDLNALIDEALNLAYHGARAQDQSFNITLERDFQPGLAPIEVVPQEITRVFLNLFSNSFYAANKQQRAGNDPQFKPTLKVTTRATGDAIEIKVRDNGTGIPPEIRDKLFQPFFTTKPTGEGTGLGLSISYDIITQQHGGTITVESEPGAYTEFTIRLPHQATAGGAA